MKKIFNVLLTLAVAFSLEGIASESFAITQSECYDAPFKPSCQRGKRGHRGKRGPKGPRGSTGTPGATGLPGPVNPLNNVIYVDGKTTTQFPDGSIGNPYPSIQIAINSIPSATGITDKLQGYVIYITSGTYNENLILNINNTQIELIALGPVNLIDASTFAPRNVTVNFTATTDFGVGTGDSVSFTNVNAKTFSNNYLQAGASGLFSISGVLTINDTSSVPNPNISNIVIYNGSIYDLAGTGNCINAVGSTKKHVLNLNNTYLFSNINGPNTVLNARDVIFNFATLLSYGTIYNSLIGTPYGGMTITQLPASLSDNLIGIYSCRVGGVFTGPAPVGSDNAYLFDAATNFWFMKSTSSLAGGATKEIIFSIL